MTGQEPHIDEEEVIDFVAGTVQEDKRTSEQLMLDDLARSGLVPNDMFARKAQLSELSACVLPSSCKGYVIPYFELDGKVIPFYRVKILKNADQFGGKYRQPKQTQNHIYIPPNFAQVLKDYVSKHPGQTTFVMFTEGEKKAAQACKLGIPCIGFGGVDSWRNKRLVLPKDTQFEAHGENHITFKSDELPEEVSELAIGLRAVIDVMLTVGAHAVICFDTDIPGGMKLNIQRAVATFAYQLVAEGLKPFQIHHLLLGRGSPFTGGIDDYVTQHGEQAFKDEVKKILAARNAFPRYPQVRSYLAKKLQLPRIDRKASTDIGLMLIAELDARGRRLRSPNTGNYYYFDEQTRTLMEFPMMGPGKDISTSAFGIFLYEEFGISGADGRVIAWLAASFTGEKWVDEVEPKRVIAFPPSMPDCIAIQTSDSDFIVVTPDPAKPIRFMSNGSKGVLFEQGQVKATDLAKVKAEFEHQFRQPVKNWWAEVVQSLNFNNAEGQDQALIASVLNYVSPFLQRWRGTQLPVEIFTGEPGSGKTSTCALRQMILQGNVRLINLTKDMRDWYSVAAGMGGIMVIDNVHLTDKNLRQAISDELCRLTTEVEPAIYMRKMYTTNQTMRVPISVTFAITALKQPFQNTDILQRAMTYQMRAIATDNAAYDGEWLDRQLAVRGGREAWLAHHLVVLHKFLKLAIHDGKWNRDMKARHRLINYQQCLNLMGEVLGVDMVDAGDVLASAQVRNLSEADWMLEALRDFSEEMVETSGYFHPYTAKDISDWMTMHDEHSQNGELTNSRKLGRYLTGNTNVVAQVTGLKPKDTYGNKQRYHITPVSHGSSELATKK